MKTSFNKVAETEKFLLGKMPAQDALVFEARLVVDDELKNNTLFHRMVHRLVLLYARKRKKAEVEAVHARLFSDPRKSVFTQSILKIFKH